MSNSDLVRAIRDDDIGAVKSLLQEGADVNELDSSGDTPLFAAARRENFEMMRVLLDNGADPGVKAWRGFALKEWAVLNDRPKVITFLDEIKHEAVAKRQQELKSIARRRKPRIGPAP
jgi:ankyrin repeat protein